LVAEWESFEKLIQSGHDDEQTGVDEAAAELDIISGTGTSGFVLETPSVHGSVVHQPYEVRQKRVFREVGSDSDGNSSSDSEDESHATSPAAAMKSLSDYKVDQQSSSSDSFPPSVKNKLVTKSSSSDSNSSSDDEKPAEQTKVPIGKCDFLSLPVVACLVQFYGVCHKLN